MFKIDGVLKIYINIAKNDKKLNYFSVTDNLHNNSQQF